MPTCFVIQPFDSGKFDKRYNDIYKPAIIAAGLEPYRVDFDHSVSVPIEAIEKGIKQAALCLADISADNPNVWYELGFAFASERPVVMVCSDDRKGKYPFDIQHRTIIPYMADAPSDFEKLTASLTLKLKTLTQRTEVMDRIADSNPVRPIEGLSGMEIIVLAVVAGEAFMPEHPVALHGAKNEAERAGVTNMGFNLSLRKLIAKSFVKLQDVHEEHGDGYSGIAITDVGWHWIEANEARFVLLRQERKQNDDNVPF
jgi:hypothetical protein